MQQVLDRPFAFSEWMSLLPNEWTAEAAPIIAAYGMGLQGWDASYAYASNAPEISPTVQATGHGVYNADAISQMGLYPALANMIYRGDVREAPTVALLNVQPDELKAGKLGFRQETIQDYDVKSFGGDVPSEMLAVGKLAVNFTNVESGAVTSGQEQYWDQAQKFVRSTTGQLHWHYGEKPFFTINTPGTQGMVGFTADSVHALQDVSMRSDNLFAVVLLSSLDPSAGIADSPRLLLTTLARSRNTNMQYSAQGTELLEVGKAPVLLEPVDVHLKFAEGAVFRVHVLDHGGHRTGRSFVADQATLEIKGSQHQTLYYELERIEK